MCLADVFNIYFTNIFVKLFYFTLHKPPPKPKMQDEVPHLVLQLLFHDNYSLDALLKGFIKWSI